MPERSYSSLADSRRNDHKKKLEYQLKKKRWEVTIKPSQFIPRKSKEVLITPEVSISIKLNLEKICLETDVIHVMK